MNRFYQILTFLNEIEKLKEIFRQNNPIGIDRRENSAEHSWQVAIMAILLQEYSKEDIDILKVVKMLLIHDIVEIDAGDTILYDEKARKAKEEEELKAANRIFSLLPPPLDAELLEIWIEFEERKSNEAIYAYSMDRLMPVVQNFVNKPTTWEEHDISLEQVLSLNQSIENGVTDLWDEVEMKIREIFNEIGK